jgi:hypothetical protein
VRKAENIHPSIVLRRDQLEASWGWSDTLGSLPFKRPKITPKNIQDQQKLARPGTLIHSASIPVRSLCPRANKETDVLVDGNVTHLATALFIDNVNCLLCRQKYFAQRRGRNGA